MLHLVHGSCDKVGLCPLRKQYESYKAPSYNETQVRREFIDPLFKALGWDIDNEEGLALMRPSLILVAALLLVACDGGIFVRGVVRRSGGESDVRRPGLPRADGRAQIRG